MVWLGGKTRMLVDLTGLQVEVGKFSASTICSRALAVAPGASVICLTGVVLVRLAARPLYLAGDGPF